MCDLCAKDAKVVWEERQRILYLASRMEDLATDYRAMVAGKLKPHSDEWKENTQDAHFIIQTLVAEWL